MIDSQVRIDISSETNKQLTEIDGKTADEKIKNLYAYKVKSESLDNLYRARGEHLLVTSKQMLSYQEKYYKKRQEAKNLAGWLTVSISALSLLLTYLAYSQGWFA